MARVGKSEKKQRPVGYVYCRMCEDYKHAKNFYDTTNPVIDKNGFMSVCKDHCAEIYNGYYSIYNNIEDSLRATCEALDVRFSKEALKQCQSHMENLMARGKTAEAVFGYYKSKLMSTGKNNDGITLLRYKDSDFDAVNSLKSHGEDFNNKSEFSDEIKSFWGSNKEEWQYEFLENEMHRLKTDFECPDYGMEMIMKDICFINLDIEVLRQSNSKTDVTKLITNLIESRSKLMTDGNLKPVQSTGADKNEKLSLGVFIKKWENEKPVRKELDDEMKEYIDVYMAGHLAKMEGLNNDLTRKYDEKIKEFTINFKDVNNEEDDE